MPFKKGQSGNPGGRPKVIAEVRSSLVNTQARQLKRSCR